MKVGEINQALADQLNGELFTPMTLMTVVAPIVFTLIGCVLSIGGSAAFVYVEYTVRRSRAAASAQAGEDEQEKLFADNAPPGYRAVGGTYGYTSNQVRPVGLNKEDPDNNFGAVNN